MSSKLLLPSAAALLVCGTASAQSGTVVSEAKISASTPGFTLILHAQDAFGSSVVSLGDLDGNGVGDIAVGARGDDGPGGSQTGAVHVLFLDGALTVSSRLRIREGESGFTGDLAASDEFGRSVCALGDLDGDGVVDIAVGAPLDDEGGASQGAVWILFLQTDGTVRAQQKITSTTGFGGLAPGDGFGSALAPLGDLDGDGIVDLAVGAPGDVEGAVWLLFLAPDGSVTSEQKIGHEVGGFGGSIFDSDGFGSSIAALGDLDANGVIDLAVGVPFAHGIVNMGVVFVLRLQPGGLVGAWKRIGGSAGGALEGELDSKDHFGTSVSPLGDLDGDGTADLAAGAPGDDVGLSEDRGAVWILFLDPDGRPKSHLKIAQGLGGFGGTLAGLDTFGSSLGFLGDLDGDGFRDLATGAPGDDAGPGSDAGAVWLLSLDGDRLAPTIQCPTSIRAIDRKGSAPGEIVTFTVTAADESDPSPDVVCVPPSGSFFPRGTTMVTCTATDSAGNQSACSFPVTVQATTLPR
jgi:hypothetical protein